MTSRQFPRAVCEEPKSRLCQFAKAHFLAFAISYLAVLTVPDTATAFVIVVQQGINCNGSNNTTDSYNSANPTQSTNGQYDPTKVSTNGDIACLSGLAQLDVAHINGALFLGPNASYGLTNSGVISGGVYSNLQYGVPEVSLPSTTWLPAPSTNIVIDAVVYSYAFLPVASRGATAYYSLSGPSYSVYVGSNQDIALLLSGNAVLNYIRVAWNGKLTIYMDGPSFTLNGGNLVDSGNAANLSYYGTTNNTQIALSGNASFIGTIYAPQADFKLLGGGSSVYDFVGTSVTRSLNVDGNFQFHFDENLQQLGLCSPQIVTQPQDQSVVSGQDATFNVSVKGVVSYQWQLNGTNIPGATASSLTITNAAKSDGGDYSVAIASPWGIQTSTQALLTVLQPPVIDTQPANAAAVLGGDVNFVVSAHGLEPLYYQWRANGSDLPGATNATLTLSAVQPADFVGYRVLVTNAVCSSLSDTALLSPAVPPSIGPVSINLGTLTVAFPTQLGPTYIVEYKFDLDDAFWQELTRVAGTGQAATIMDNGLTSARKFYRVRLQ